MMAPPSSMFTVPVGAGALLTPDTATVNDTDCPNVLGLGVLETLTTGFALATTCVVLAEDPPTKLALPPKTACKKCLPALVNVVVRLPVPEEFIEAVPSVVFPSANISEPDRLPLPGKVGCTVAVRVTGCPITAGFSDELSVSVSALWL